MNSAANEIIFWLAFAALLFTFAGYPVLMGLLAAGRPKPVRISEASPLPRLTCLVVAHNEAERIGPRVENFLAADYPAELIEVVVVVDGATDSTGERVRALGDARVRVIIQATRQGKAAGLNAGVAAAAGEVMVFADARQRFAPDALRALARNFSDPAVGAVSGNYCLEPAADAVGEGVDAYWRLEKIIRAAESRYDSSIGCTGAIYAIRRALFQPLPPDTILDDVVIPMQVALQGKRVVFEPEAKSFEPLAVATGREFARKRRTLAGNFQMLFRHGSWLWPWSNRLWWQLVAHKYLRLAAPPLLLLLLATNVALAEQPLYRGLLMAHLAFYFTAVVGIAFPQLKLRLFSLPAGFVFLNFTTGAGFWHYLRQPAGAGWASTAPAAGPKHV